MKVVHIESGLGNQMLSYCEYLALKKIHPSEDIYIENIVYDILECNEVINQWNGYELERIFGIKAPNIRQLFTAEQWQGIMDEIRTSKFWEKNWNYPVYITQALCNAGLDIRNIRGDFESSKTSQNISLKQKGILFYKKHFNDTLLGEFIKRTYYSFRKDFMLSLRNHRKEIFYEGTDNIFTGQWGALKSVGNGMEQIEDEVRRVFKFPEFTDSKNIEMSLLLDNCQSVAIHARRGDMLGCNGYCYKYGYFRRAVKHIRRKVESPVFVFFTDPGSIEWCKENGRTFGLNYAKDKVLFVDWNTGQESYRDMQLMGHCKHAIITISSFGWWGAFFITNPDKITITPKQDIATNTTYHC